jgi:hypothetical protein
MRVQSCPLHPKTQREKLNDWQQESHTYQRNDDQTEYIKRLSHCELIFSANRRSTLYSSLTWAVELTSTIRTFDGFSIAAGPRAVTM